MFVSFSFQGMEESLSCSLYHEYDNFFSIAYRSVSLNLSMFIRWFEQFTLYCTGHVFFFLSQTRTRMFYLNFTPFYDIFMAFVRQRRIYNFVLESVVWIVLCLCVGNQAH